MNTDTKTEKSCPNCQSSLYGQYCFSCGQNQKPIDRAFTTLVSEFFEDIFAPNSKTARTLFAVCFKPGHLTREYFSGRKARYIQPIRLYLTSSIIFFFLASLMTAGLTTTNNEEGSEIKISGEDIAISIEWPSLSVEDSSKINLQLELQLQKAITLFKEDPEQARENVIDAAPPVIFCLVPLFALLLKLTYFNKGRYYTEHLVLALHNHSFLFLAFMTEAVIDLLPQGTLQQWLEFPVDLWIAVYLFLSLKITYGDGWLTTSIKFIFLGLSYWFFFALIALISIVIGVLTL